MREEFYYYIRHFTSRFSIFIKWLVFSLLSGVLIGGAGTVFHYCMVWANDTRLTYPCLILLLPLAGLLIVWAYHMLHDEKDTGTNLVLAAIHSGKHIPMKMAPLIFISTITTHLFGGSAGREGAALQLGDRKSVV